MRRNEARKAWAAALGVSLLVHALIAMSLVHAWNRHRTSPVLANVEVTIERPTLRSLPKSPPREPQSAADPFDNVPPTPAPPARPLPLVSPSARTVPSTSPGDSGSAPPRQAGVDLRSLAYPPPPGCDEGALSAQVIAQRPECDPKTVIAADLVPPRKLSTTEPGYPPPSTPEWERAAATQKAWRAYRECGNFFSCGDLNKCSRAGKNKAAGCDTYPGLGSLIGRIFGD